MLQKSFVVQPLEEKAVKFERGSHKIFSLYSDCSKTENAVKQIGRVQISGKVVYQQIK